MTRTALPFSAPDLSALARSLEKALSEHHGVHGRLPGHVEMMNLLACGVGQRNLQSLQAAAARQSAAGSSTPSIPTDAPRPASDDDTWFDAPDVTAPDTAAAPAPDLTAHARKALQHFDLAGRLERWPLKFSVQRLAMWVLWTRFDARRVYTESEVNRVLNAWHLYGDHATLRRELINHGLMSRKSDCSEYRKLAVEPDAEVRGLLQSLRSAARRRTGPRSSRPARAPRPAAVASENMVSRNTR